MTLVIQRSVRLQTNFWKRNIFRNGCSRWVGLAISLLGVAGVSGQIQSPDGVWEEPRDEARTASAPLASASAAPWVRPQVYHMVRLNTTALRSVLDRAPGEFTADGIGTPATVTLPMPDGTLQRFHFVEAPVMEPKLAAKYTDIRTYRQHVRGVINTCEGSEPAKVRQDLASIRATAREMVQALDEIVWAVDPAKDSAAELASYLCQWAQDFFRSSPIRCRLDVAEPLPAHPLMTEVRHNLFLGFKEALNNAARHSAASEVWVRVRVQGHSLHVRVEDNGQGFDPAAARGGHGLANMQARLQALGGRAEVRSQPGRGTSVTFHLPLQR
jgi:two-component sensor histidine kinase